MRQPFGTKSSEILPLPNLSSIQHDSFNYFLQKGLTDILEEINPIKDTTGRNWELTFENPRIDKPNNAVEGALKSGMSNVADIFSAVSLQHATPENRVENKHPQKKSEVGVQEKNGQKNQCS